mgnify:CR=1 FL=1
MINIKDKKIIAFDIQAQAISQAKANNSQFNNIEYILDGHEHVTKYVQEQVKAIIYNLGFLPKGNKNITTLHQTTLDSLDQAMQLLVVGGRIAIVVYSGHPEGKIELEKILSTLCILDQKKWEVWMSSFINQKNNPPQLIVLEKLAL